MLLHQHSYWRAAIISMTQLMVSKLRFTSWLKWSQSHNTLPGRDLQILCLFACLLPYSKSLTMLFSPSLLRQMEIISFSHSPLSPQSFSLLPLSRRSVTLPKPQALFVSPSHSSPPLFGPSLTVFVHLPLHRFISKRFQTLAQSYNFNKCFITFVRSSYRSHDTHFPRQEELMRSH